jgi:hypothetical protein
MFKKIAIAGLVAGYTATRMGVIGNNKVIIKDIHHANGSTIEHIQIHCNNLFLLDKATYYVDDYIFTDDCYKKNHYSIRPIEIEHHKIDGTVLKYYGNDLCEYIIHLQ